MLKDKEGRALIGENYRILSNAIDTGESNAVNAGLKHEVPAELTQALKENAYIFSGFKAYHTMNEAGLSLKSADGGIKDFNTFKKEAGDVFKAQKLNLRAEYQHAVQSAQMAAKWQDIEADGDRYDLQYRTAGDDKVRDEHTELNNTTLPPSNPFWKEYYPPNGWGCRCTAVQVRKGKYPQSDGKEAIKSGQSATQGEKNEIFRFNAGTQKKVFPDKHPNFPKGCGKCDSGLKLAYNPKKAACRACLIIAECKADTFDEKPKE